MFWCVYPAAFKWLQVFIPDSTSWVGNHNNCLYCNLEFLSFNVPDKMITLLGGAGRLPSTSELTQTPVLLQAVLPWHFVWKLYGIKDVRISKHRVGRNCIFSFMGCSYLMNQDVTMQGIFSSELSVHLTLSGLLSTTYIITHGKKVWKADIPCSITSDSVWFYSLQRAQWKMSLSSMEMSVTTMYYVFSMSWSM